MKVYSLLTLGLLTFSCFGQYNDLDFNFNFKETADENLTTGCVSVGMKKPPIYLESGKNKDYVKDLCLTISKNKNGTYKFSYIIHTNTQTLNLELIDADISENKLAGTIFVQVGSPGVFLSENFSEVKSLYDLYERGLEEKMMVYINIINQFSTSRNKLFFDPIKPDELPKPKQKAAGWRSWFSFN
jgi:hypothetical protein